MVPECPPPDGAFPVISSLSSLSRNLAPLAAALLLATCTEAEPTGPRDPVVTITSPISGATILEGAVLQLRGSASDPQDGVLPDPSLLWTSSIDGEIGTGGSLEVSTLSVGVHTLVLTAADSDGHTGRASTSVAIQKLDFLDGTAANSEIAVIVNTLSNAVRMVQIGDPLEYRDIALGASSSVTATSISIRGERAAVPLGNAASVALIDLRSQQIEGFFLFESGNATGSAFVDHQTILVANQETDEVGRIVLGETGQIISDRVDVAPFPTAVLAASESLALVISSNLDDSYMPSGEGVVTAIDPTAMAILGTVNTGGMNPQYGALGPDGRLYLANTGDYISPSSLAIIDPETLTLVDLVEGFGPGSGDVFVDSDGLVYVSGFFFGTVIWDSTSRAFVRGPDDPVCAPLASGGCRGAMSSYVGRDGTLYQAFFGSPTEGLPAWLFSYRPGDFQLTDSIPAGLGPVAVEVCSFRDG